MAVQHETDRAVASGSTIFCRVGQHDGCSSGGDRSLCGCACHALLSLGRR